MRPLQQLLRWLAALALAAPVSVLAEPVGYAVGSGGPGFGGSSLLYRIDLATGQSTLVGPIGFVDVEGAALAPDGQLYAVADAGAACEGACGGTDLLLRIDPATGAGTLVGPLGLAGQGTDGNLDYGLATTCSGQLWLTADTTGQLWEVDPSTGATRLVGNTGAALSGLAAWGGLLFGVSVAPDPALYRIDPATAVATRIGALGLPLAFFDAGLDFDAGGVLWATIDYFTPPDDLPPAERNDIARIDVATGAATLAAAVLGAGSGLDTVQMEGLALAGGAGCGVRPPHAVPGNGEGVLLALAGCLLLLGALRLRAG